MISLYVFLFNFVVLFCSFEFIDRRRKKVKEKNRKNRELMHRSYTVAELIEDLQDMPQDAPVFYRQFPDKITVKQIFYKNGVVNI